MLFNLFKGKKLTCWMNLSYSLVIPPALQLIVGIIAVEQPNFLAELDRSDIDKG